MTYDMPTLRCVEGNSEKPHLRCVRTVKDQLSRCDILTRTRQIPLESVRLASLEAVSYSGHFAPRAATSIASGSQRLSHRRHLPKTAVSADI